METQPEGEPQKTQVGLYPSYIGTKVVQAIQMTSNDFKARKGIKHNDENAHGYLVIYEDNYQSWSPKEVFERCYRRITEQERRLIGTILTIKQD